MRTVLSIVVVGLVMSLAGCSNKGLRLLRSSGEGPDEFKVLPVKPLSQPESFASLPEPTPGGANRVDPNPLGDAVAALGGRPAALVPGGVSGTDGALVSQTSRYGVPAGTRVSLSEADAKFRKRAARSSRFRLFPVDRYEQAYRKQALEPFGTAEIFRRSGRQTPSAPPKGRD